MAPRESEPRKETVERVMHEFKHGELRSGTSRRQKRTRSISAIRRLRSVVAKRQRTKPKARRRAAHDPPNSGPNGRPYQAAHWRCAFVWNNRARF
jgi:hypothetical protein